MFEAPSIWTTKCGLALLKLKQVDYCHLVGRPVCSARHAEAVYRRAVSLPLPTLHVEALLKWTFADKWALGASHDNLERMALTLKLASDLKDRRLVARCTERYAVYLHLRSAR